MSQPASSTTITESYFNKDPKFYGEFGLALLSITLILI